MIDYTSIGEKELSLFGIAFDSPEETKMFADFVLEKLEIHIGEKISEGIAIDKLEEFDLITDNNEAAKWLQVNRPDYRNVVKTEQKKMAWNLLKYREKLSNCKSTLEPKGIQEHIRCLKLGANSYKLLNGANLLTVKDVLDFDILKNIIGLENENEEEIVNKIVDYLIP